MPDNPTIFDFGMHRGEDTAFYLAAGASVIAFEANHDLVVANTRRFADAIADGRLTIVEGAIVDPDHEGDTITFYLDDRKSVWGTTRRDWAARNSRLGSTWRAVTVPTIDLKAVLARHPHALYAKIDIEGADQAVLRTLATAGSPPTYVSIESDKVDLDAVVAEIDLLASLGYRKFAAVEQASVPGRRLSGVTLTGAQFAFRFQPDASGPFGQYLAQPWQPAAAVIDQYHAIFRKYARFGDTSPLMRSPLTRTPTRIANRAMLATLGRPLCGWYDTHASL